MYQSGNSSVAKPEPGGQSRKEPHHLLSWSQSRINM
jgi:hypothetical protein